MPDRVTINFEVEPGSRIFTLSFRESYMFQRPSQSREVTIGLAALDLETAAERALALFKFRTEAPWNRKSPDLLSLRLNIAADQNDPEVAEWVDPREIAPSLKTPEGREHFSSVLGTFPSTSN